MSGSYSNTNNAYSSSSTTGGTSYPSYSSYHPSSAVGTPGTTTTTSSYREAGTSTPTSRETYTPSTSFSRIFPVSGNSVYPGRQTKFTEHFEYSDWKNLPSVVDHSKHFELTELRIEA
ncbi:hypothetical protein B0T20DRAFT_495549 [Sordaria brevicollis]|uniref:Uncharacterized protein n=1 Tax=Sordaria brevicollis TaxID=83679 RepID=A0AAE0UEM6_SORBR|nr:hypothetical protein B0T20DRAFT_495549 [Sordaria brevicollis]